MDVAGAVPCLLYKVWVTHLSPRRVSLQQYLRIRHSQAHAVNVVSIGSISGSTCMMWLNAKVKRDNTLQKNKPTHLRPDGAPSALRLRRGASSSLSFHPFELGTYVLRITYNLNNYARPDRKPASCDFRASPDRLRRHAKIT